MATSGVESGNSKSFIRLSRYALRIGASAAIFGMITACGGNGNSNANANTRSPLMLFSKGMPGPTLISQALAAAASAQIPESFEATCNFSVTADTAVPATPLLAMDEGISDTHGADGCPATSGFIRLASPNGSGVPVFTAGTITTLTVYGVTGQGFGALTCSDTVHTAAVNDKDLIQAYFNDVTGEVSLAANGVKLPLSCTIGQVPPTLLNLTVRWAKV